MMIVSYVTGGPVGADQVRAIDYRVGSFAFSVRDEQQGEAEYRSVPYVNGTVVVEDALSAASMIASVPTSVAFSVVTATDNGTGTIAFVNFQAMEMSGRIGDGTRSSPVTGYAVRFRGHLIGTQLGVASTVVHTQL